MRHPVLPRALFVHVGGAVPCGYPYCHEGQAAVVRDLLCSSSVVVRYVLPWVLSAVCHPSGIVFFFITAFIDEFLSTYAGIFAPESSDSGTETLLSIVMDLSNHGLFHKELPILNGDSVDAPPFGRCVGLLSGGAALL